MNLPVTMISEKMYTGLYIWTLFRHGGIRRVGGDFDDRP